MAEVAYATGPALLGAPRFAQFRFFSAGPKTWSKIKKRGTANEKARRRGPKTQKTGPKNKKKTRGPKNK